MLKKTPSKNGTRTTVTFELPSAIEAETAAVCGDFNDWAPDAHPMKRRKDGCFAVSMPLAGGSYQFKYLLDGRHWVNDWNADAYEQNGYGSDNSVVIVGP